MIFFYFTKKYGTMNLILKIVRMIKEMNIMNDIVKKNTIVNLFNSLIFMIIGIILVTNPNGVLNIISYIICGALFLYGAINIFSYFKINDSKNNVSNIILFSGIFSIALGLTIVVFSSVFEALVRIIIGFIIIYNGVVKLKTSLYLKQNNISEWIYMFAISLIVILCGIYIFITSGIIFITIGVITIVYGILDLIQNILYIKNYSKIR